jgi:pectin methylesterase-like acyl-CoA thioesterase
MYSKLAAERTAPIAGQITVMNLNATVTTLDLSTCGPTTANVANSLTIPTESQGTMLNGCMSRYITVMAVSTSAVVSFSNANSTALQALSNSNTGVNGVGAGFVIPSGSYQEWMIHPETRWMSFVATTGSGTIVIVPSSRGGV